MFDLLIGSLTFLAVMGLGGAAIAVHWTRREPLQRRMKQLEGNHFPTSLRPVPGNALTGAVARVGDIASSGKVSTSLTKQLSLAGFPGSAAASIYIGTKVLLFMLGLAGSLLLAANIHATMAIKVLTVVAISGLLSFIPNIIVGMQKAKRNRQISNHLPDAVDLLEICVSSGMGLEMAWNLVSESIRRVSPVFADEMALTNLEIHLGAPRMTAMRHMAQRTGTDELTSLVGVLVQSDRFGTSIADALRAFATSMREGRTMRAEEVAEKMAVKLLFPMVVFIFPAVLIVAAGPAGMTLARIMSSR